MNGEDMEITTEHRDNGLLGVSIKGDMNIYHALDGKDALMKALGGAGEVEFDLTGVKEFDSSGLQLLLLAFRETARNGGKARLSDMSGPVESVIWLFNLHEHFGTTGHGA